MHEVQEIRNITWCPLKWCWQPNLHDESQVINVDEESYPACKMGEDGSWSKVWEEVGILHWHRFAELRD